jgi:hypothetical protein
VVGLFCWSGFFVGRAFLLEREPGTFRQLAFQHGNSLFSTVTRFSARSLAFQHGHSLFSTVIRFSARSFEQAETTERKKQAPPTNQSRSGGMSCVKSQGLPQ